MISTEEEVARARTEVDLASAEAERQLTRLRRTSIRAPIDGLITKRLFEPGDMLAAQSHILTIIDPRATTRAGRVTAYADVEAGVEYLKWLRSKS